MAQLASSSTPWYNACTVSAQPQVGTKSYTHPQQMRDQAPRRVRHAVHTHAQQVSALPYTLTCSRWETRSHAASDMQPWGGELQRRPAQYKPQYSRMQLQGKGVIAETRACARKNQQLWMHDCRGCAQHAVA